MVSSAASTASKIAFDYSQNIEIYDLLQRALLFKDPSMTSKELVLHTMVTVMASMGENTHTIWLFD